MKLASGHEVVAVSKEYQEEIAKKMAHFGNECCVLNPGGLLYPGWMLQWADSLYNFKVRSSDIFVASSPKTGSTWTQEIVWAMCHNPNLDHRDTQKGSYSKAPIFETDIAFDQESVPAFFSHSHRNDGESFLESFERLPNRRVFKTHFHFNQFQPKSLETAKFVYILRDPLDTCVSFFHFSKGMKTMLYPEGLPEFIDDFLKGNFFSGSYVEHLKQWWQWRNHKNVHTIFFEDLKRNTMDELHKLNTFLETDLTEAQLENVRHYTSFAQMKSRDPEQTSLVVDNKSGYFRSGTVGSSSSELTTQMKSKIKNHFRENLGNVQLPYDLNN